MSDLSDVLTKIGEEFKEEINPKGSQYILLDLGDEFRAYKKSNSEKYDRVNVVIPLKRAPETGLGFIVNGNELSDKKQLENGLVVPDWVATEAQLTAKDYTPKAHMTMYLS